MQNCPLVERGLLLFLAVLQKMQLLYAINILECFFLTGLKGGQETIQSSRQVAVLGIISFPGNGLQLPLALIYISQGSG